MIDRLAIPSPKQPRRREGFQRLYSYYAGFPETFVAELLASVPKGTLIYDPWNGSGTTTAVAARHGLPAIGHDLNPVMALIAKARLLPRSETSSIAPLAQAIVREASPVRLRAQDPLLDWFMPESAKAVRAIERSCHNLLANGSDGVEDMSCIAATFYAALFSVCRNLASSFRSSNPTWMRVPEDPAQRARASFQELKFQFLAAVQNSIEYHCARREILEQVACEIRVADATLATPRRLVDLVVTSPPYCTRIDYAAATRIELAVIDPLSLLDAKLLRRQMTGTTMVPCKPIELNPAWGDKCIQFLANVKTHASRASQSYYFATHADYFEKMFKSLGRISLGLRKSGTAIMVIQDSYYKAVHNDLAGIISEMAAANAMTLRRREDFRSLNCMSRINSRSTAHGSRFGSTESVLCFEKQ